MPDFKRGQSSPSTQEKYLEDGHHVADHTYTVAEEDPDKVIVARFGKFGVLMEKLFANGVEARGVERVPEDQRENRRVWNK